jgi:hypothetical protein
MRNSLFDGLHTSCHGREIEEECWAGRYLVLATDRDELQVGRRDMSVWCAVDAWVAKGLEDRKELHVFARY